DSGAGSLRDAILAADANPGGDTITFNLGAGVQTIAPTSPLPTITEGVIIDGTQGGGTTPLVLLDGTRAGRAPAGLVLGGGSSGSVIKGLAISNFVQDGILIQSNENAVQSCYLGTDATGAVAAGDQHGVDIQGGAHNLIGGLAPGAGNVLSGNK